MIVLQPTPNDIHHSFTATRNTDLSNPVIANYTAIEQHPIQTSMYQSASLQAQQSFAYPNAPAITNTHQQYSALHSRSPSESSLSRNSPSDNTFIESASYTLSPSSCRYDNPNMSTQNMPTQDTRSSPLQNQGTPVIPTSGESIGQTYTISNDPRASVTVTTQNNSTHSQNTLSVKASLPSLSEVLPSQTLAMQAVTQQATPSSPTASPTQPQLVPNIQVQQPQHSQSNNNLHMTMATPTAQSVSGFYQPIQQYSEVNATYANASADANYTAQQSIMTQNQQQTVSQQPINQLNQQNMGQTSQLTTLVDPRTLPPIVGNTTELPANLSMSSNSAALVDATGRRLTLNTGSITVNGTETSLGNNSSTGSHIMPSGHGASLNYSPAAFLNGAFVTAAHVNNVLMSSSQRTMSNRSADRMNGRDLDNASIPANIERPQKVYSFVPLPGINTKKRPRRRYDEIERHYSCNWPGCSKSYGTLNHLNAHVQMQKHGPKRNPAEFKEQRKIWRRQKREEEERKAVEAAAAKQSAAVVTAAVVNSGLASLPGSI
ncbi:1775_t:CDS:2 [Paraglomus occultum]|uniref:1775_t:CDS:1 n=1 Tax=Paraglomus occultum TaxID=144539 RepID=A0A9N9ABF9_9GLOM|nr:1775_t:CDS:2 [Paraglomus occultum]